MKERLTTAERGYGYKHRKLREQWRLQVEAGLVDCASCHEPVESDDRWDLGHTPDRTDWTGPEHVWCNRSTTVKGQPWLLSQRQRPRPRQRNCENCGCEYRANYREQRFCGRACAIAMQRHTTQKLKVERRIACLECGQVFTPVCSQRICSDQCRKRRDVRKVLKRYHANPEYRAAVIERAKARYRRRSEGRLF